MDVKKLMWAYLIAHGEVLLSTCYYGGTQYEVGKANNIRAALASGLWCVNWGETSEVKDGLEEKFNGTFADNPDVPVLTGHLVLTDRGSLKVEVDLHFERDATMSFTETVCAIAGVIDQ